MKNKALKIVLKVGYYALCGYLVGLLISYIHQLEQAKTHPLRV